MQITKSNFLDILQQKVLIELAGKGVTDENFESVVYLSKLLQEYKLCTSESYAEIVAFEFFDTGVDSALNLLQFAKEGETDNASTGKLNIILEEHSLNLNDWSKAVNLSKNIESIIDQLKNKSAAEVEAFLDIFMKGKPIALQGGSIQGTKFYDSHAPEKSKIKGGWIPFEIKPNPGKGNSAEYRLYGIYKDYTMVIIYKSIKNGGQGREDSAYDKFGVLANNYIASLAENLLLTENIRSSLLYNINKNNRPRGFNFMQESKKLKRFEYSSVAELMNDQLDLFESLDLANERQNLDLYVEGVDDGYAGVDKKDHINESYHRGYEVGKAAKAKEIRFKEFQAKLAAYKASHQ